MISQYSRRAIIGVNCAIEWWYFTGQWKFASETHPATFFLFFSYLTPDGYRIDEANSQMNKMVKERYLVARKISLEESIASLEWLEREKEKSLCMQILQTCFPAYGGLFVLAEKACLEKNTVMSLLQHEEIKIFTFCFCNSTQEQKKLRTKKSCVANVSTCRGRDNVNVD